MKTLGLFRHAKSDWHDARARDFDRPLNSRGKLGASVMGAHIRAEGTRWDRVIASPAVRVAQTIDFAAQAARSSVPINWDRRIYLASSATLLDLLKEQEGNPASVMMIGHNPGLEDLIFDLVPDDGSNPLRDRVEVKFPTAALAILTAEIGAWAELKEGSARLVHLTRPRDLDSSLGPDAAD